MGASETADLADRTSATVSTGDTVEFPVSMDSSIRAVVLPADAEETAELLPDSMSPIRAGNGSAALWLMSARHQNVGTGSFNPYNEFAIMISATPGETEGIPYLSPLWRTEAFVCYMPVTTEEARIYGEDVWGFPKTVAEIDREETTGGLETTVTVDGDHLITFEVGTPPAFSQNGTLTNYTVKDGTLLRIRSDTSGQMGMWPYTTDFSYTLGDHPKANVLQELDLGTRAFARLSFDGELQFPSGTPIDD